MHVHIHTSKISHDYITEVLLYLFSEDEGSVMLVQSPQNKVMLSHKLHRPKRYGTMCNCIIGWNLYLSSTSDIQPSTAIANQLPDQLVSTCM